MIDWTASSIVRSAKVNMNEERVSSSLPQETQVDVEGTGSDAELERGGKQAKFDEEDSDNDSTVSSSNSNSTQATVGKRGFRGKGRKKKSLAFRCVNFLKVTCFHLWSFQLLVQLFICCRSSFIVLARLNYFNSAWRHVLCVS